MMAIRTAARCWRAFRGRDRRLVEDQLNRGVRPLCPCCGTHLDVRRGTRLASVLPGRPDGSDLECRCCRQFLPRVRHSERSLRLLRLQRFAASVLRA
jgi:hypothetical protein